MVSFISNHIVNDYFYRNELLTYKEYLLSPGHFLELFIDWSEFQADRHSNWWPPAYNCL